MEQTLEVTIVKDELIESTSNCETEIPNEKQMTPIKNERDCLVRSEIYIKTEPQEYDSEYPVIAGTSYEMCSNYDIKVETDELMVKLECQDLKTEIMEEDPLDISGVTNEEDIFLGKHLLDTKMNSDSQGSRISNLGESSTSNSNLVKEEVPELNTSGNQNQLRGKNTHMIKKHACHICYKMFRWKSDVERHLSIHRDEKPFTCHFCEKKFNRKGTLDAHMVIHSGEKPYVCDICKKVFGRKAHLEGHKLIHGGVKPYSCSECNKSFIQKRHLVQHIRMHTGDKPFACEYCEKAFTVQSSLIRHVYLRHHTEEEPF